MDIYNLSIPFTHKAYHNKNSDCSTYVIIWERVTFGFVN